MTPMRHAMHARLLIAACGGIEEAAAACRLSNQQLSNFQNPDRATGPAPQFMPTDVVVDLEGYCGKPLYSQAMAAERPSAGELNDLVTEAVCVVDGATSIFSQIALAIADKKVTQAEARPIQLMVAQTMQRLSEISTALAQVTS